MRDSDIAIGGLVLLGIVGAFAYFLFPNFITGILRGPSYTDDHSSPGERNRRLSIAKPKLCSLT